MKRNQEQGGHSTGQFQKVAGRLMQFKALAASTRSRLQKSPFMAFTATLIPAFNPEQSGSVPHTSWTSRAVADAKALASIHVWMKGIDHSIYLTLACFTVFSCFNYRTSFSSNDFSSCKNSTKEVRLLGSDTLSLKLRCHN